MSHRTWRKNPELAVVDDGIRVVVVRLDALSQPPRLLDGTAISVWEAIDGSCSVTDVIANVARGFDVESSSIANDVRGFLADLADLGLVVAGD